EDPALGAARLGQAEPGVGAGYLRAEGVERRSRQGTAAVVRGPARMALRNGAKVGAGLRGAVGHVDARDERVARGIGPQRHVRPVPETARRHRDVFERAPESEMHLPAEGIDRAEMAGGGGEELDVPVAEAE